MKKFLIAFLLSCLVIVPCNAVFNYDQCDQNCNQEKTDCDEDNKINNKEKCLTQRGQCRQTCAFREQNEQARQRDNETKTQNFRTSFLGWTKLIVTTVGAAIVVPFVAHFFPNFYSLLKKK
ncbi:MAG: hypothetical protein LBJ98_01095 [Endomicrobium sp.]|nr:hypothetical protein [Endomicrobium sp.]